VNQEGFKFQRSSGAVNLVGATTSSDRPLGREGFSSLHPVSLERSLGSSEKYQANRTHFPSNLLDLALLEQVIDP
jgi:hypothetical protein